MTMLRQQSQERNVPALCTFLNTRRSGGVFGSRLGTILFGAIGASLCTALALTIAANMPAFSKTAEDDAQIAKSLATMLRAGRTVISKNQDRINDPNTGNKGLNGKTVLAEATAIDVYKRQAFCCCSRGMAARVVAVGWFGVPE